MILTKLYSELQLNPRSKEVYRKIMDEYCKLGMLNEAKAFEYLIEKKFHVDSSNSDEEQSKHNTGDP